MGAGLLRIGERVVGRPDAGLVRAMNVLALVGARFPLGVAVAVRHLVAGVRVDAVASQEPSLKTLLERLEVSERRRFVRRRHGRHEAFVVTQPKHRDAAVVRLCGIEE